MLTLVLVALLSLSGCMGDDEKKPSGKAGGKTETSASGQSTATSPGGEKVEVPEEAIASRDGAISGTPVKLELLQLKRGGETSVLTFRIATVGGDEVQIGEIFDDGANQEIEGAATADSPVNTTSMDGITLVDTQNRKRYLVGRDSKNACACESDLGGVFLGSDPVILSATYAAPPEDVSAMDVLVPRFGTFKDVPVS
jgi:hypothetical protein